MKINKLTASFGKLQNESLSFHEGLNVIYAPNESGKSTWCAFIRAMLYGVDSAERAKSGHLPDKLRYAPWSGAPMEGSMELTAERCDITIVRSTKSKNAPMREFSATYTGSNVKVEGLNAQNAGEMLTGVSKDVFRRSAFIAQGSVAVSGSPELERRISAIVSTGEEHTSYSEADERLRTWQRKRRYNRRGMLPELESSMAETRRRLEDMSGSIEDVKQLEQRLEQARQSCAQLEREVTESRKKQRKLALDRLNAGRMTLRHRSEEHDAAMTRLSEARQALREGPFGTESPGELEPRLREDLEALHELKERGSAKHSPLLAIILFVLAVAAAAAYTLLDAWPFIAVAALLTAAACFMFMRFSRRRNDARQALDDRMRLLKGYKVSSATELRAAYKKHLELWLQVQQAEENERSTRADFESARMRQNELEESALSDLDFTGGSTEAARLGRELSAMRSEAERLSARIASANGRLAAMGDPLVLSSSLGCMAQEHALLQEEYDAISLALDALREADAELQSRFSPELGRVAAEYMSLVTDGRYSNVFINRDFSARIRTSDDAVARDAEYLSAGTLDLMYLAVRLAVCQLALPEGESCPLIIDDALVNLDEDRLEQAMKLLREIAKKRQVILFSCRKSVTEA